MNPILYLSLFSVLLPLFFWLRKQTLFKNSLLNIVGVLLIAAALSDLTGYILLKMKLSNYPVYNIFFVIQFILLSFIYSLLIEHYKRTIYLVCIAFISFVIACSLWIQPIIQYQSWTRAIGAAIMIIYGVAFFVSIMKNPPEENIFDYGPMWLNIAFISYFTFNLVLFVMSNYILTKLPPEDARLLWKIHNCNNILKNILLAFSIYRIGKHVSNKSAYYKKFGIDEDMLERQT